ncbi:hypothetical protein Ancab_026344 [Ancistrocladus abbreviatus]
MKTPLPTFSSSSSYSKLYPDTSSVPCTTNLFSQGLFRYGQMGVDQMSLICLHQLTPSQILQIQAHEPFQLQQLQQQQLLALASASSVPNRRLDRFHQQHQSHNSLNTKPISMKQVGCTSEASKALQRSETAALGQMGGRD